MLLVDLLETPEKDLERLSYARKEIEKFTKWLYENNKNTPLKDMDMIHAIDNKGKDLWLIKASKIGMAFQNLYIGIGWKPHAVSNSAFTTTGEIGGSRVIMLVIMMKDNPKNEVNLYYKLDFSHLIHEFVHVIDYRRGYINHRDNLIKTGKDKDIGDDRNQYYNSPIEFNGYYQQGVYEIMNKLTIKAMNPQYRELNPNGFKDISYKSFKRLNDMWFDPKWLAALTSENKRRFDRRFYKFYDLVKKKWPDMEYIQHIIMQEEENA